MATAPAVAPSLLRARGRAAATPQAVAPAAGATLASVVCGVATSAGDRLERAVVLLRRGVHPHARAELRGGRAAFTGLAPGRYSLEVDAASLPAGVIAAADPETYTGRVAFSLGRGERRELVLPVVRAATVQGFVRGAAGEPLAGALVRLQSTLPERPDLQAQARSGPRGEYALVDVLPGEYRAHVEWPAERCEAAPPLPALHVLAPGAVHHVDFRGEPAVGGLAGRVLDERGAALAGVTVLCEPAPDDDDAPPAARWSRVLSRTVTAADGSFALTRLPAAHVVVRVAPRGGAARGLRTRTPELVEVLVGPFELRAGSGLRDVGAIVVRAPQRLASALPRSAGRGR